MVNNGKSRIILIIFFSLIIHLSTYSQNHKYFIISGKIISDSECLDSTTIQIVKNNEKSISTQIPENGRFRLELEYNTEYQLVFSKNGNLSKTITVNTEVPSSIISRPDNFPRFLMAVKLFKDNQDLSNLYSGNQIQQIGYSEHQDCFIREPNIFDSEYVQKDNHSSNQTIQAQVNKAKMQVYQVF